MYEAKFFDIAIEACIIFLIIFTPMAFGSVGLGPQIVFISISEFIFFLWLLKSIKSGRTDYSFSAFSFLFVIFLAVIFFQTIPLPKFLLKVLSPAMYRNYVDFLPGYKEHFMWRSISAHPQAARIEFLKFLPYALIIFVIADNFKKKSQILHVLGAVSIAGFIIAIFGIAQKFSYNGMIYWAVPVPEGAGPFGPFVNKNHFAGFMELAIPITAVFVFITQKAEKKIFFAFMAVVMLLSLFLCLSRAGIVSFFLACGIVMALVFLRRSLAKYIFYALPVILIIFALIFLVTKGVLVEKFAAAPEAFLKRAAIYKDTVRMFLDFPLFGSGLAGFTDIFPMYKTYAGGMVFRHPESDWLQFLSETGLAGFLCIVISIWLFFKDILCCHFLGKGRCVSLKNVNLRHDRFILLIISAGIVSIISIILHGFLDVNLHIPSNMLLTCIVAAILVASAHVKFKKDDNK